MILFMIACILMNLQAKKLVVRHVPVDCGIQIAHISDLHFDKIIVQPAQIIRDICKNSPEIIILTGDLCSDLKYIDRVTNFLDMLVYKAGCPILITLGNHDNAIFHGDKIAKAQYISAIEAVSPDVKVLENERYIYKNVLFGGLTDIKTNQSNYKQLASAWSEFAAGNALNFVLISHNPDIASNLTKMDNLKILLTGHTHGGQVRLPFNIEFTLLKNDRLPKKGIYYGFHNYKGIPLYITSGIGCSLLPIRFRSKAEIAIFSRNIL